MQLLQKQKCSQLFKLWWILNSGSNGYGPAVWKGSSIFFGRYPANYMCVSSWLHFAFIKARLGLSWSRVNDLISNLLIFCIFIILMRWWACSHGRPKTFPIRIWYSLSIGELWVGLCSLLQHLNEFWVLLCLSYGPIISFFFKQYISEMSLLQTKLLTETAFYILIPYSVYSCLLRRQLEKLILSCYLISKTTCNLNPVFNKNRKMPIQKCQKYSVISIPLTPCQTGMTTTALKAFTFLLKFVLKSKTWQLLIGIGIPGWHNDMYIT